MWKIHRYYLKEVTVSAVLTFGVLFGIVLLAMVARGIEKAQGGTLTDAAWITILWTLDAFPHLLTISLLFATVTTFARASQDREITAMRSAGISPRVPMVAALLVGVAFSLGGSHLLHQWIPTAHFLKYRVISEVTRQLVLNLKLYGDQIPLGKGRILTFVDKEGTAENRIFKDCTIFSQPERPDGPLSNWPPVVRVNRVRCTIPEGEDSVLLHLEGSYDPLNRAALEFRDTVTIRVNLRHIAEIGRRSEGVRDMASDQLLAEVERHVHPNPTAAYYTVNRRGCFALMAALFAPIGFCIGVLSQARGRLTAMLFALVPLAIFYICDVVSGKLAATLDMPLLAWSPALVIALLGAPFCWRLLRL